LDGVVTRVEGLFLFLGIITYTIVNLRLARREKDPAVLHAFSQATAAHPRPGWDLFLIGVGIGLLVLGGRLFLDGALGFARRMGASEALIALTVVALGTSLPELAATVVAAFRREADIAIGNIIGSNIFNLLNILGISAMVQPLDSNGLAGTDLLVMIGLALITAPLMRTGFTLQRWEGGLFLLAYGAYVFYLWTQ
jgi:cation:H+ antiporter